MVSNTLLLVNENSSRADSTVLTSAIETLESAGITVNCQITHSAQEVAQLINRYQSSVDLITVMGGDGTVNTALEPVIKARRPLGVLPTGTGNDFARSIGIGTDIEKAAEAIVRDKRKQVSVGSVNGNYFLNAAHIGLGASASEQLDPGLKSLAGVLAYPISVLAAFRRNKRFAVKVESHDWQQTFRVMHVAVANGRFFGGGHLVDQSASLYDDNLRLFCLERFPWWKFFFLALTLRIGLVRYTDHVNYKSAQHFEVATKRPMSIVIDGENIGTTPACFKNCPSLLEVIAGNM
ncbi:MAG: YegS/Rv2252/BmrU family lipid kinase [Gammaproteobacteria bacterium]